MTDFNLFYIQTFRYFSYFCLFSAMYTTWLLTTVNIEKKLFTSKFIAQQVSAGRDAVVLMLFVSM